MSDRRRQEPELQSRIFTVGDRPHEVWDWDLDKRNLEYLQSLDPDYFLYAARTNYPNLEADDPKDRQRAATAIRVAYHHGLESLFSLIFAALQARHCVVGWMQVYTPSELRKLVRSAGFSSQSAGWEEVRAYRERILPYVWLGQQEFRWEGISKALIRPAGGDERAAEVQRLFAGLWRRLARDFLNDSFADEYNSMKHGLRTGPGGFRFALSLEDASGETARSGDAVLASESEHGSSFFVRRTFVAEPYEQDQRAGQRARHFRVRRQLLNWDPRGLCDALVLISVSIHNIRNWLLALNGVDASNLDFRIMPKEAFQGSLGLVGGASSSGIDLPMVRGDLELLEGDEIKLRVAEGMRELRERQGGASSGR
jgi:hypothetical protein